MYKRKKLALLLPGHNEELIIKSTIKSAIAAGMNIDDIYFVDDFSSDNTLFMAGELLPVTNLLKVERSGKAKAVYAAIKYFKIESNYEWVHVADADSIFDRNYFNVYASQLTDDYAAAVGFVQSLKGNYLCSYRAVSYTYGQHIIKRVQALFGMITVMPGPVTSYRTDIIKKLNFFTGSVTEDFDLTLQIHRQSLGKIKYLPDAVNYTQDPRSIKDYYSQTQRWYRGFFQGIKRYRVGIRTHRIDLAVLLQVGDLLVFFFQLCFASYILLFARENMNFLKQFVVLDLTILFFIVCYTTILTKRPRLLLTIFYFHIMKAVELGIYIKAFIEVIILRKYSTQKEIGWDVKGRRYALSKEVLADFA